MHRLSVILASNNKYLNEFNSITFLSKYSQICKSLYDVEIILILNGISKGNKVISYRMSNIEVKVAFLKKEMLSFARNVGINMATGDIVAFIDDDAVPDTNWSKNIVDSFEASDKKTVCLGGKVLPIWGAEKPKWLSRKLELSLSLLDLGNKVKYLEGKYFPVGTNMAFRRDILLKYGGFSEVLGRKKNKLISNEENLLFKKLLKDGYKIIYNPDVVVYHCIPKERLTKKWFYKRMFYQGISNFVLYKELLSNSKNGKLLFYLRGLLYSYSSIFLLFLIFLPTFKSKILTYLKCMIFIVLGHSYRFINSI